MKNVFTTPMFLLAAMAICPVFTSCSDDDGQQPEPEPEKSCVPANLQNGLVAFYPFSGGSLDDHSGNNHHLSNPTSAFASADRSGNAKCAFEFSAANSDFLTIANPVFLNGTHEQPLSVSLWLKTTGTRNPGTYEQLFGRGTGLHCPDTQGEWSVGLYDCRQPVFGINDYSLWKMEKLGDTGCTGDPVPNVWHHLVVTSDGTAGGIKLYVDGALSTGTPGTGCGSNTYDGPYNVGDLFLGKDYTGLLDDVMLFNRVLTQSEVTQLFGLEACCL